jgi:pre-mRNA-splicing factor CDC5/CEF1
MRREAARAAKLEARAATVTGGLAARAERLRADAEAAAATGADARVELACFRALHEQEGRAAPERIEALAALAAAQAARERALQGRFAAACRARDDLLRAEAAAA